VAERNLPHIVLSGVGQAEAYTRPRRRIEVRGAPAPSDRLAHATRLKAEIEAAQHQAEESREAASVFVTGAEDGIYLVFDSFPELELALESLDPRQGKRHPELISVRRIKRGEETIQQATVFVPAGKLAYFLRRLERYVETLDADSVRYRESLDRIAAVRLASIEALWTDPPEDLPEGDIPVWWEVWQRRRDGEESVRLREFASQIDADVSEDSLAFPDRTVTLLRTSRGRVEQALVVLDDLAELRRPRDLIGPEPPSAESMAAAVAAMAERVREAPAEAPTVCVVDQGVHQAHPLLQSSLDIDDCHACDQTWGVQDDTGHGTMMAGIALLADVEALQQDSEYVDLRHRLESVKFRAPPGHPATTKQLIPAMTVTATSLVEIQAPARRRTFALSTSAQDSPHARIGAPTSWSAAIDALAAGLSIDVDTEGLVVLDETDTENHRLFVTSAGNIRQGFSTNHLARSDVESIEDPAQAWNALSVGAYTELDSLQDAGPQWDGWAAVSPSGELSPFSRTSVAWDRRVWPVKPDVLCEGGNLASSGDQFQKPKVLQVTSTRAPISDQRLLGPFNGTSAACARASHLAATIMAEYPSLWPETVRALIVHSARWTSPMEAQLAAAGTRDGIMNLLRRYGYGVPDEERALKSASDALTLVLQDVIHPFDGDGRAREMHLVPLPWPEEALRDIAEIDVQLRVSLSYFIEPNPARRSWKRRYAYQSHGLRFEVRRPEEAVDEFRKRLNQRARSEEERFTSTASDTGQWMFGSTIRSLGSIHTDIWRGSASELADRGMLAVFPVTGWWKEYKHRDHSARGARYSLVVSIETPPDSADVWTPVAQQVGIPVPTEITTQT
jgi:subtilisin family serine protease